MAEKIDLKLYNTIVIFDVYTVARSPEAARDAVLSEIVAGAVPSEQVAQEVTHERSIRASWIEQTPYVATDVSEEEFERLKGSTTLATFKTLYHKKP